MCLPSPLVAFLPRASLPSLLLAAVSRPSGRGRPSLDGKQKKMLDSFLLLGVNQPAGPIPAGCEPVPGGKRFRFGLGPLFGAF